MILSEYNLLWISILVIVSMFIECRRQDVFSFKVCWRVRASQKVTDSVKYSYCYNPLRLAPFAFGHITKHSTISKRIHKHVQMRT